MKRYTPHLMNPGDGRQWATMFEAELGQWFSVSDVEDMTTRLLAEKNARIAELEKALLERGGHKQDCPISWKGECYCGWLEMKQSLMER